jgi:hypothetical protein
MSSNIPISWWNIAINHARMGQVFQLSQLIEQNSPISMWKWNHLLNIGAKYSYDALIAYVRKTAPIHQIDYKHMDRTGMHPSIQFDDPDTFMEPDDIEYVDDFAERNEIGINANEDWNYEQLYRPTNEGEYSFSP